jgi:hypothetical protein
MYIAEQSAAQSGHEFTVLLVERFGSSQVVSADVEYHHSDPDDM